MKSICKDCKHKDYCDETVRLYGLPNMRVTECKEFELIERREQCD